MGEIAESLINGEFDYITGEYIGWPVGYPRTIHGRGAYPNNAVFGVSNWFARQGVRDKQKQMEIIKGFFNGLSDNESKEKLCADIQKNFGGFVKYAKKCLGKK